MKKVLLLSLASLLTIFSCKKQDLPKLPYPGVTITDMCFSDSLSLYYISAKIAPLQAGDKLIALYLNGKDTISMNKNVLAGDSRFTLLTHDAGCGHEIQVVKLTANGLQYTYSKIGTCTKICDSVLLRPLKLLLTH